MGAFDDREMLEVAKEECGRLERENAELRADVEIRRKAVDEWIRKALLAREKRDEIAAERDGLLVTIEAVRKSAQEALAECPDDEPEMSALWVFETLATSPAQSLANLQAALVLEYIDSPEHAESLREAKYDAWGEGYEVGVNDIANGSTPLGNSIDPEPSPYRKGAIS